MFKTDNDIEFINDPPLDFFLPKGFSSKVHCGTSQQNDLVERKHRHLLEITKTIKFHTGFPKHFWESVFYL